MESGIGAIERKGASGAIWEGANKLKSGELPKLPATLIVHHSANGVNSDNRQRSHELLSAVLRSGLASELLMF